MKKLLLIITVLGAGNLIFTVPVFAGNGKNHRTPEQANAQYTRVIDLRSRKIAEALHLTDTNKAARVQAIIMAQYRALNDWHNVNDPRIKAAHQDKAVIAKINEPLRNIHDEFLGQLAQYLTSDQIETVKDKMTYGKVEFTFKGYCVEYPNLTPGNKQEILKFLKQAREEAMDAGSAKEKTAIFNQYKGKINNYLAKQGVHSAKWLKSHEESKEQ